MAKRWRLILTCVLVGSCLPVLSGCGPGGADSATKGQPETKAPSFETITIKDRSFKLELALDQASRMQGLSDRKEIPKDGGMLFVFGQPVQAGFVMRRCYVPIDLIFVDRKGYIDSLHRMKVIEPVGGPAWENPLRNYSSAGRIQYAIELKGGTLDKLGLERSDKIELPFDRLQSRAQ